jgi:hypothetical protein
MLGPDTFQTHMRVSVSAPANTNGALSLHYFLQMFCASLGTALFAVEGVAFVNGVSPDNLTGAHSHDSY